VSISVIRGNSFLLAFIRVDSRFKKNGGGDPAQNPVDATCSAFFSHPSPIGKIAQLVEQRTENPCVPGSIPGLATIFSQCEKMSRRLIRHSKFAPSAE
jgi:hypothetical protein